MITKEKCERHSGKWENGQCKIDIEMDCDKKSCELRIGDRTILDKDVWDDRRIEDISKEFSDLTSKHWRIAKGIRTLEDQVRDKLREVNYFINVRSPKAGEKDKETATKEVTVWLPESLRRREDVREEIKSARDTLVTGEEVFDIGGRTVTGQAQHMEELPRILEDVEEKHEFLIDSFSQLEDFTELSNEVK